MNDNTPLPQDQMKMPEENFGQSAVEPHSSHMGVILGVLIVALVLILGGLYLWSVTLQTQTPPPTVATPNTQKNEQPQQATSTQDANALSTSDEIQAIDTDLQKTDVASITSEIPAIEARMAEN